MGVELSDGVLGFAAEGEAEELDFAEADGAGASRWVFRGATNGSAEMSGDLAAAAGAADNVANGAAARGALPESSSLEPRRPSVTLAAAPMTTHIASVFAGPCPRALASVAPKLRRPPELVRLKELVVAAKASACRRADWLGLSREAESSRRWEMPPLRLSRRGSFMTRGPPRRWRPGSRTVRARGVNATRRCRAEGRASRQSRPW